MIRYVPCLAFNMADLIKICGVALLATFCAIILKALKVEYASFVRVAGVTVIFSAAVIGARSIFSDLSEIIYQKNVEPYVTLLLKALGIGMITRICSDVCKDSGEASIGSGVELCGKITILALCIPTLKELMGYASELLSASGG